MEDKKDLPPHITLESNESTRLRGVGRSITSPLYRPFEEKKFIKKINWAINENSVKLETSERTYFLIDLTLPHYNSEVRALIKRLKLDVKAVLNEFQILVATEKNVLVKYLEKGEIHKSTLKVIKDINKLESSYKIGRSLKKLMGKDIARMKAFSIYIKLINMNEEERRKCLIDLKKALYNAESIIPYDNSQTISCICSTSRIKDVAKIPFVKLITESPKPQQITSSEDLIIPREEINLEESESLLTPICIMDSGTAEFLDPFTIYKDTLFPSLDYEDTQGHGTSVASVAIFGEQLIKMNTTLRPLTNIISFKLDDKRINNDRINFEEVIKKAVKKYKSITPIFNLSYNYMEGIPLEFRKEMVNAIDKFVQKENVIIVNSAGNIPPDQAYYMRGIYPKYLTELNILCPSEARNIFAVGSICKKSSPKNIIYSKHTRIGVPPYAKDEESEKNEFFKPEVHTLGGNSIPDDLNYQNRVTPQLCFPTLNKNGDMIIEAGTSFSAPLISLCFSRIHNRFKDTLKNVETYKAILLNQCIKDDCCGLTTFSLLNTEQVGLCSDAIYFNFEGKSAPHEKSEEKKATKVIKCQKIKFYVPKEAKDIEAVIVHSNNYDYSSIEKMNTKVILKLKKPTGAICKQDYGNIGKKSAVTYAKYGFSRGYEGEWEADLHIETSGIPSELFNQIDIRYGVSFKINLKDKKEIKKIYDLVLEKTESAIKTPIPIPVEVVQKMPQITFSIENPPNTIELVH